MRGIRGAIKGQPGLFYAIEAGHVLGTPFPAGHPVSKDQDLAVVTGCTFAVFMAMPAAAGGDDGAH